MMQSNITLLTLFILGFFGGTHCVGMCGGLSSAFALQLPSHIKRIYFIVLMNLGRLISYVFIGALMGALSKMGSFLHQAYPIQLILLILANILLLLMGLHLAGLSNTISKIDVIGRPIWQRISPFLNRLLPIQSLRACVLVGILWGWLPCGLVYNAALYALGSGSATQGALYLLAFGLGTLPNLLAMGVFATQLKLLLQDKKIRFITGLMVCAWAVYSLWRAILLFQAA